MCCISGVIIPITDPCFSFFPTRPDPHPNIISFPASVSFRVRPGVPHRPVKSILNDTVQFSSDPPSFYDLLGIPETGNLLEIKQAYKQLARKYHPDVSPPDQVEEYTKRFIQVQEAYETLSDPRRRALYDRDLAKGIHFAFSARRRIGLEFDEQMEDKNEWKSRWESQLSHLKKRSMYKDSGDNMSWGARMRRQRNESS
ncbi:Chaperone protein dnaJ 20 [Forsythia ovata]|uniref:Chaperone protein dnaJ 20 n=1 Tax=Forsythia ovata TaxID=205694 RepID=A0ABD1T7L0_9LAMI